MTPQERLKEIEAIRTEWIKDMPLYWSEMVGSDQIDWLISRVKSLEKALEQVREKTITDPAGDVELRARAASVFSIVCKALKEE